MEKQLNEIFNQLTRWRSLPNYQMERRIDIFFSIYLHDLLEFMEGSKVNPIIIPEFPIKRGIVREGDKTNKSIKIDYVAFDDIGTVYYIELKTDIKSRSLIQDQYLEECRKKGFNTILDGLKDIFVATKSKNKYYCLFELLQAANVVKLPDKLKQAIKSNSAEVIELIKEIKVVKEFPNIKIVYIQPRKTENKNNICIEYDDIVNFLQKRNDGLSSLFSEYLPKWKNTAG